MTTVLLVLHLMVCFVLITVVLLQRGKGSDLGAALGGGGANTVFGGRGAGNFLTKITTGSAMIFMCTSLSLAYLGSKEADVQLFDASDLEQTEDGAAGLAPSPGAGEEAAAGELEEIPFEDVGGLEEIPQPE